ncbi:hypothetical protein D3C74_259620 [compost metagenome]
MEEPFHGNFAGDEPEENLRYPPNQFFGLAGMPWATMYELRLSYRKLGLEIFSEEIGNVFSIRVRSPQFAENDKRFIDKRAIELDSFDDRQARLAISNVIKASGGITIQSAIRKLENHFFVDEL